MKGGTHMKTLQSVVNDFLDNIDQYEDHILESIAHIIETELMERDFMSNPQNFQTGEDDVN
jgi:hypothetical protein